MLNPSCSVTVGTARTALGGVLGLGHCRFHAGGVLPAHWLPGVWIAVILVFGGIGATRQLLLLARASYGARFSVTGPIE